MTSVLVQKVTKCVAAHSEFGISKFKDVLTTRAKDRTTKSSKLDAMAWLFDTSSGIKASYGGPLNENNTNVSVITQSIDTAHKA